MRKTFDDVFKSRQSDIVMMGHRGGYRPKNSLDSFRQAKESGIVQIVELDVST